jgi:hypothetical protein
VIAPTISKLVFGYETTKRKCAGMDFQQQWRAPVQVFSFRYLIVIPVFLAITTAVLLFLHSDDNVAMLYSQCHARARLPELSHIPVIGTPSCYLVSFFQFAIASARSFATLAAILSFIGGLLTVSLVEAARICNGPNILIAYPTGAWLVFNLMGGAIVWQLVIIPAFFYRARSILAARRSANLGSVEELPRIDPNLGDDRRHLAVKSELIAIPAGVTLGFVVPSLLMIIYNTPLLIVIWLFFPVWVSIIRQTVRFSVFKFLQHERKSFHLESHRASLLMVYAVPVTCSILSYGLFFWSLTRPDDRKEMTRATLKFIEIDMAFIVLTVLYWIFVEAGWRVALVMIAVSIALGPGAGICICWIYREDHIHKSLTEQLIQAADEEGEARQQPVDPSEDTPLLH